MSAFNQPIFNSRERPMTDLLNRAGGSNTLREMLRTYYRFRSANWTNGGGANTPDGTDATFGFIADGFRLYRASSVSVGVRAGVAFYRDVATLTSAVDGISGLEDSSSFKPIVLDVDAVFAIPAANTVNPRYDIIEVRTNRARDDFSGRDVLDVLTGDFLPDSVATNLDWSVDSSAGVTTAAASTLALSYRRGTAAASPTVPSVTPGYIAIGYVYVGANGGGVVSVTDAEVMDYRKLAVPPAGLPVTVRIQYVGGSAGGVVEASTRVSAPPGITVVVVDDPGAAAAQFDVCFVGGPLSEYEIVPVGVAAYTTSASITALTANVTDNGFAAVSAGDVTDFADSAITSPAALAVGQYLPSTKWTFTVNGQKTVGGSTGTVVLAGSRLHLTFMIYPKGPL